VSVEKKRVEVAIALVWRDGLLLVSRRRPADHLGGSWEFPGGKLERGESVETCAEREVLEEVGLVVRARSLRRTLRYEYPDRDVTLHPVDCEWVSGEPVAREVAEVRFIELEALPELEFPPANAPLLEELLARPR
jgi:8-oxo-dGTP diphosphatase